MKVSWIVLSSLLAGCTTSQSTGRKYLLGAIPVPFTGGGSSTAQLSPVNKSGEDILYWAAAATLVPIVIDVFLNRRLTKTSISLLIVMGIVVGLAVSVEAVRKYFIWIVIICVVVGIISAFTKVDDNLISKFKASKENEK